MTSITTNSRGIRKSRVYHHTLNDLYKLPNSAVIMWMSGSGTDADSMQMQFRVLLKFSELQRYQYIEKTLHEQARVDRFTNRLLEADTESKTKLSVYRSKS